MFLNCNMYLHVNCLIMSLIRNMVIGVLLLWCYINLPKAGS